jgi:thioredoxin reductase/NAD-dependent dihydropyrimidine dehydrogenase PreA subunit
MVFIWALYIAQRVRRERANAAVMAQAISAGLSEPASLHPVIDHNRCISCGSCTTACPEGKVLGLINGKSTLINPSKCIGHGACKRACPVDAITLVFGTEQRGIDIPNVAPNFETNIPGLFIAGELGGMGLIRNAIEQGKHAMESIYQRCKGHQDDILDVLIVGSGPAGIAASLSAMERKMKYATIEQDSLGGTVFQFPRGKVVMTTPVVLPMVGKVKFTETTKEKLLQFWQQVEKDTGLTINYHEQVTNIEVNNGRFLTTTSKGSYQSKSVLLAIGRRGTPRKLDVEGEDLAKVVYRLIDPGQYRGQHVLVVGGGDSALEAAASIADEPGTMVTISYRSDGFNRAKEKNRQRIDAAVSAGKIRLLLSSTVTKITHDSVLLEQQGTNHEIHNDAVIVSAGGILPTPFLKQIGIEVETKHGTV